MAESPWATASAAAHSAGAACCLKFRKWLGGFADIPLVCVGLAVQGWPSVYVDNGTGMYAAISHLIEAHQRRRIAFVRGPAESAEAEARFAAYQRALADHDIPPDPKLVFTGDTLARDDGAAGVRALFEERGFQFSNLDANACVNDDVALGALEALHRRGMVVPDDLAVVGFDDGPNASAAHGAHTIPSSTNNRVKC